MSVKFSATRDARVRAAKRAAANRAREEAREVRRQTALRLMIDWPDGMPPLSVVGADIGTLRGLAKDGLAEELPRDVLGDMRFRLTPEGMAQAGR